MTDPIDDAPPQPTAGATTSAQAADDVRAEGIGSGAAANDAAPTDPAPTGSAAPADPAPTGSTAPADPAPTGSTAPADPTPTGSTAPGEPPLQADPHRPADSGWREPAWFPPGHGGRHRDRDRRPGPFAIVVGLVLIAVGLYAFVDRTLGIALPAISWSTVWPVMLIVVGALIILRSFQRRA